MHFRDLLSIKFKPKRVLGVTPVSGKLKELKMRKLGLIIICLSLINGCAVKLVYNQLDWLIPWYLSDYLELTNDQEAFFEARLAHYLEWHRKDQLPRYADFLNRVSDNIETGLSLEDIASYQTEMEGFSNSLMLKITPDMLALFEQASDQQLQALYKKFEADNENYRKQYVEDSATQQRKRRVKEVTGHIERWTGNLSKEQEAILNAWGEQYVLMGAEFLEGRKAWQEEFKAILAIRADQAAYQARFKALLSSTGFGRTTAFEKKLEQNKALLSQLYSDIDKSLSDTQRRNTAKRMRKFAKDFQTLAAEGN